MLDPQLGPEWKPDRAKFVMHMQTNCVNLQVAVDPSFPNAWTKPPYYEHLKRWAREGGELGALVFVRIGGRVIALLPDRDHDMGLVNLDDEIVVSRHFTGSGYRYDVAVKRATKPQDSSSDALSLSVLTVRTG